MTVILFPVPNVLVTKLDWTSTVSPGAFSHLFWQTSTSGVTNSQLTALAALVRSSFGTNLKAYMSSNWTLAQVTARDLGPSPAQDGHPDQLRHWPPVPGRPSSGVLAPGQQHRDVGHDALDHSADVERIHRIRRPDQRCGHWRVRYSYDHGTLLRQLLLRQGSATYAGCGPRDCVEGIPDPRVTAPADGTLRRALRRSAAPSAATSGATRSARSSSWSFFR